MLVYYSENILLILTIIVFQFNVLYVSLSFWPGAGRTTFKNTIHGLDECFGREHGGIEGLMLRPMVVTNSTSEASTSRPSRNVLVSLSVVLRSLFADALMTNTFIFFMIIGGAKERIIVETAKQLG